MRRLLRFIVPAAGMIAIAAAVPLITAPVGYGWTASVPLSDARFDPSSARVLGGALLALVGVALVSGWIGYLVGRRARATR